MSDYEKLVKEALLNNSFDENEMTSSLKRIWNNSFSYLLALQNTTVGYEEFVYHSGTTDDNSSSYHDHIGKLYVNKSGKACFDIGYDIIDVCNREEFRLSDFFLKAFDFKDLIYNPQIFLKMPIILIDDQVIWDYKILVNTDSTTIVLPFNKRFVVSIEPNPEGYDHYVKHTIQIRIVDNNFYTRSTFTKTSIGLRSDKTIYISKLSLRNVTTTTITNEVNEKFLKEYNVLHIEDLTGDQDKKRRTELSKRLRILDNLNKKGTLFASIHYPNIKRIEYELGTMMIPFTEYEDYYKATLSEDLYHQMVTYTQPFYMSFFFIEKLMSHEFYTGLDYTEATEDGCNLMVLEQGKNVPYSCPIPTHNFMIFKEGIDKYGYTLKQNDDILELHYPNIYQVVDPSMQVGDKYKIFYFYDEDETLKYTVLFDFYFKFIYNRGLDIYGDDISLEKIIDLSYKHQLDLSGYTEEQQEAYYSVFEQIYQYQYFIHYYGETDFLNRYIKIIGHEEDTPFEYKINTMKEWVKVEPWALSDYVANQDKLDSAFHLFANTIDLPSRVRTSTERELDEKIVFPEPMYVFALNNTKTYPEKLDLRIFVDGLTVTEDYHYRKLFMDYIYIPTRLVKSDSYIELEIFSRFETVETFRFESLEDSKEVTILDAPETVIPTVADLFYKETNERYLVDQSFFDITIHTDRIGDIEVKTTDPNKPVKFTRLNTFKITPKNDSILNTDISMCIKKSGNAYHFIVERSGYLVIKFVGAELDNNFDVSHIRIFDQNGRLIPSCNYMLININNEPRIYFFDYFEAGDKLIIDFSPYSYKEICHIENISPDNNVIDLSDYINKPCDVRYYDIYLNGRRLSLNNVIMISPYQIALVNLHSVYNLDIYEKERDWEYFGLDYNEHLFYFSFEDLLNSGSITEDEKSNLINEIISEKKSKELIIHPNTNEEEKQHRYEEDPPDIELYIYYYDWFIPKTFMDPDTYQENATMVDTNFHKIAELYKKNDKTYMLDPDIIDIKGEEQPMMVYSVGHLNELPEEVLEQQIQIKEDFPIE